MRGSVGGVLYVLPLTNAAVLLYMVDPGGWLGVWLAPFFLSTGRVAAFWVMAVRIFTVRSVFCH